MRERRIAKTYKVAPSVHREVKAAAAALSKTHVYPLSGDGRSATTEADIVEAALVAEVKRLRREHNRGRRFQ